MSQGTFVGRQPIVDRDQHVVAYELLFRNSRHAQFAEIDEVGRAAVRVRLETIDDAVRHLGLQQLGRWVSILLYAQGDGTDLRSPLLSTAAHRGRLMELVIDGGSVSGEADSRRERAFLVGMLSLADALLGRSIDDLVHELRLGEEIARALTHREGELGELLSFAEAVERSEIEKFEDELERWDLDLERLQQLEHDAYAWVHGLMDPESSASAL